MSDNKSIDSSSFLPRSYGEVSKRDKDPKDITGPGFKGESEDQDSESQTTNMEPTNSDGNNTVEGEPESSDDLEGEELEDTPYARRIDDNDDEDHDHELDDDPSSSSWQCEQAPEDLDGDYDIPKPDGNTRSLRKIRIAGVRFACASKIYHFNAGDMELLAGDWVIVKTEKGIGLGRIAFDVFEREVTPEQFDKLRNVVRKASKEDFEQKAKCKAKESEAYLYCCHKIDSLGLPMKLVAAECFFDHSKYIFYFTADGRVDFRELVKQLVSRFPVRIEMRQIGVRHEAKMTGGLGCCGQELCCSKFLVDFKPVSVRMAKDQNLSLNPGKISGSCGRLMCCLSYEHETYEDFKKGLPRIGRQITTDKGEACVVKYNALEDTVTLKLEDGALIDLTREEIAEIGARNKAPSRDDRRHGAKKPSHRGKGKTKPNRESDTEDGPHDTF